MADFSFLFQAGTDLLDLLSDYSRIPVRIADGIFRVRYSSSDIESFRKIDFREDVYQPLFRSKKRLPILRCAGSLELIAAFPFQNGGEDYFLVAGPVLLARPDSAEAVRSLCYFPAEGREEAVRLAPVVGISQFVRFVRLLYTMLLKKEISVGKLIEQNADTDPPGNISRALSSSVFEQRENPADRFSYSQQFLLLNAIKAGNLERLEYLSGFIFPQDAFELSDGSFRRAVYQFVGFVTLIACFAVEGGLEEELASNLSGIYIQKADQSKTSLEIFSLLYTAAVDFTTRVQEARNKNSGYSGHVILCIDYISRHLHDAITLEGLADEIGLNPAYLSVLFKKETGLPLADFIQTQRIEEAKSLLRFSERRIAEISSHLAFSSQSYFTSVFKRHTGMTPKKYREAHYRKNW